MGLVKVFAAARAAAPGTGDAPGAGGGMAPGVRPGVRDRMMMVRKNAWCGDAMLNAKIFPAAFSVNPFAKT